MSEEKRIIKTAENTYSYLLKVRRKLKLNKKTRKSYSKLRQKRISKIGKTVDKKTILRNVYLKFGRVIPYLQINDIFAVAAEAMIDEFGEDRPILIKNFGTFSILHDQYKVQYKSKWVGKRYIEGKLGSYSKIVFRPAKAFNAQLKLMRRRVKDGLLEKTPSRTKKIVKAG